MRMFPKLWGGCFAGLVLVAWTGVGAEATEQANQEAAKEPVKEPVKEVVHPPKVLPPTIVATNGKTYESVKLLRVEPDGLNIEFAPAGGGVGLAKIKFRDLPESLQHQFGYDPEKAKDYEMEQGKAMAVWRSDLAAAEAEAAKKRAQEAAQQQSNESPAGAILAPVRFQAAATIAGAVILDTWTGEAWLADLHSTIVPQDYTEFLLPKLNLAGPQPVVEPRPRAGFVRGY